MSLRDRIPVEPLDEQRVTNIERRLVARAGELASHRAPASRRPSFVLGMIAAAAVAGVIGWMLHRAPAQLAVPGQATQVAGTTIDQPLVIATDREHSTLDIGDATIASDPATQFTVTRPSGGVLVAMTHGKVELEVQKRGSRPPLVVRAGDTDVVVVGTHFSVAWDGHGPVEVRVTEGKVRVKRAQQETFVAGGQAWSSDAGLVALADALPGDIAHRVADHPTGRDTEPADGSGTHHERVKSNPLGDVRKAIEKQPLEPALAVTGSDPMQAYSAIVTLQPPSPDASAAFYSMALVRYQQKHEADALRILDGYFRRFSGAAYAGSTHYQAALWLKLRIVCLEAVDERCRQAAYQYSKHVDVGPKAGIADQIEMTQ